MAEMTTNIANMTRDEFREYRQNKFQKDPGRAVGHFMGAVGTALIGFSTILEHHGDDMPEAAVTRIRQLMTDLSELVEDVEISSTST